MHTTLSARIEQLKSSFFHISGARLFALFLAAIVGFASYFTFVIPGHFLFSNSVIQQEISLKRIKLAEHLRKVMSQTSHGYASQFLKRVNDGATVYSYVFDATAAEPLYARIAPDQLSVTDVRANEGLLTFTLRLPPITLSNQEIIQQPMQRCSVPISAARSTDSQQDLIYCNVATAEDSSIVQPITQQQLFLVEATDAAGQPATAMPLVFAELKRAMPMARALERNNKGHFAIELANFPVMAMYSASLITTTGTLGIEPASLHARALVALESVTGVLILCWFLARRFKRTKVSL